MSAATTLLQRLAERAEELLRGGYLLVQAGEGLGELPETVALSSGAHARVVGVPSELHLRHALWAARGTPLIAVVPDEMASSLPADLVQNSERQRVHALSGDEVLAALLGTRVTGVDDGALRALAIDHADQLVMRIQQRTTPTVIDRPMLERLLVEVLAELADLRGGKARPATLLGAWLAQPPAWPPAVERLAHQALATDFGDVGRVLGWAAAGGMARCRALVVHGAVLSVEGEVPPAAWGPLGALKAAEPAVLRAPGLARNLLVSLARDTIRALKGQVWPYLVEADSLARQVLAPGQLATSDLLPLAFEEQAHDIARVVERGEPALPASLARLRNHAMADAHRERIALLDDLNRLARYLARSAEEARGTPEAAALASAYLADDAFADQVVRRVGRALASARHHHHEARQLLDRVIAHRDGQNERYALALAARYEQTLFSEAVVGLPRLVGAAVAPAVGAGQRVLVVVLDGCAAPVFYELLDQLLARDPAIGLERSPSLAPRLSTGLAPLPSITSHARGALFLGALPGDAFMAETAWRESGERQTDPARFRQNRDLGAVERQLFLKGDLADGGRALVEAAAGPTPVVAVVFNAVDDRIGSHDTGAAFHLDVRDVAGLLPTLDAALESGRRVLVTADHGHSPFRGTELRVGAGSTPRFYGLRENEAPAPGFAVVDCGRRVDGAERMAFAWKAGVYRGQVQVGFHGGCSLEEMVVPVAWLARDGAAPDRPPWWSEADVGRPEAPPQPAREVPRSNLARPLPLPFAATTAPVERLPAAVRAALDESEQRAVAWILVDGPIRTSLLARQLGRPANRVAGLLSKINRSLVALGARLVAEDLPELEQQWRYEGPRGTP